MKAFLLKALDHLRAIADLAVCNPVQNPIMELFALTIATDIFDDRPDFTRAIGVLWISPIMLLVQAVSQRIIGAG